MRETIALFVFKFDELRYAVHLSVVQRVIPIIESTPLPKAPEIVTGLINLQGTVVPVVNMRRRFRLPEREAELDYQMIVAQTARRTIAFAVDAVQGIVACNQEEVLNAEQIVQGLEYIEGVVKTQDGILFIHDLDRFLSLDEEKTLSDSLTGSG